MSLIPKVGREHPRIILLIFFITLFLWFGVALHLFSVWWMVCTSLKPSKEVFRFPPTLWPHPPSLHCYRLFFRLATPGGGAGPVLSPIYVYLKNSIIITAGTMFIQIPLTAFLAYGLSKLTTPRWSKLLLMICIGTLMIPAQISLIPRYLFMRHFPFPTMSVPKIPFTGVSFPSYNFLNSYWAVILPFIYSAFNVLLFKGFFDGIPNELINAARLDGASEFSIVRRIILPISKPVFAVVAYFSFSATWNQFMWPLIVIQKNELYPLSVLLYQFQEYLRMMPPGGVDPATERIREAGIGYNGLMTVAVIESIPVFIMFIIFREQLMTGIKLRGFK